MAIVSGTEIKDTNLYEIELYTERFLLYVSPTSPLWQRDSLRPEDLLDGGIWAMRAFHDHYPQLSNITHKETFHNTTIDRGSLHTLINLVNANGGYTLIPEMFKTALTPDMQRNLRSIQGPKFFRTISLVIRQDYMRERMLNIIADSVKRIVPREMLKERILKFKITL
jgi:LysR family hydrogen peroxide-inducible transcriptional activator